MESCTGRAGDEIREHVIRNVKPLCLNPENAGGDSYQTQLLFVAVEMLSEIAAQLADLREVIENRQ